VQDGKLRVGDFELTSDDVRGLLERKGIEDSRRAQMPATAGDYSLDLPKDFQLPADVSEWKWDVDNPITGPLLGQAKEFAHANGLDQAQFSKMLGLYVTHQLHEQQMINAARKAEIEKLGPNVALRVDSVQTWLRGLLGDSGAKPIVNGLHTADQIRSFERIISAFVGQGVSGNPAGGRDGAGAARGPQKVSDEVYNSWTWAQKQAYAQQFDQSQHR
jgi:hypothetical protein